MIPNPTCFICIIYAHFFRVWIFPEYLRSCKKPFYPAKWFSSPIASMNVATPFNIIIALSFQTRLTYIHPIIPVSDKQRSKKGSYCAALIAIAISSSIDAIHFTYQSKVYFGVADLNIRLEFSISSGVNLGCLSSSFSGNG